MILRELPAARSAETERDDFVEETLRSKSQYGHFWNRSAIIELKQLPRKGAFLVDDTQQEIGAFKIRGAAVAVNEAVRVSADRLLSVCAASSGSFGMGIASVAARLGLESTIFMPADASGEKKQRIRSFGAVVDDSEPTYEAARQKARIFAEQQQEKMFIDGVGWEVFKGNATLAAEVVESSLLTRGQSAVLVPLGIGSLAVPMSLFLRGSGFASDVFLVEPLTYGKFLAEHADGLRPAFTDTIADGAGVRALPDLTRCLLDRVARAVIALTEEEIIHAMRFLWEREHIQSEGAGALAMGAFLTRPELFDEYDQVWLIVTGRNIESSRFRSVLGSPNAAEVSSSVMSY